MQGFFLSQAGHVVNAIPAVNVSGGVAGQRFSMKNYSHASIIVSVGVSATNSFSIVLKECTAASGGTATAIAFNYFKQETALGDTLGAPAAATTTGIAAPSANDNIFYVIELDARHLSDGYPWVEVSFVNASAVSIIASAIAVLSGGRNNSDQNATAIV